MTAGLQVSRLIDVNVNLEPAGAQFPSVTTALFIGSSDVINVNERYRSYGNLSEVADDFSESDPEYISAALFFGQSPSPEQLYIGRWAETATAGLLIGGTLSTTEQLIATWTVITNGEFKITEDGGAATNVTCGTFAGQTNLNGIATVINTALAGATLTVTVAWNGSQFVFTSGTTGAASAVAFLTAPTGGTDIHSLLKGTAATGATTVNGIIAESPLACVEIMDNQPFSFYMLMFASVTLINSQIEAVAAYIEGDATPHIYALTVQDPNAVVASNTTDIGYILQQLEYERTCYQYSSTSPYAVASMLGRAATVDYEAQNSTITLMYKSEPGVTPELLLSSQASSLDGKNYSYYATFNNGIPIIVNGTMADGLFFDDVQGADWMVAQVQTDLFNVLYQTLTKIPQTDAGVHVLTTTVEASLSVGLSNGQIGPGVWAFNGFGNLKPGQYLEKGFYVYAPSVATQSSANRNQRKSPTIQAAVIFAGAIQKVAVIINVQR